MSVLVAQVAGLFADEIARAATRLAPPVRFVQPA